MAMSTDIVIIGAGIAGLATASALKRVGIRSLVLERGEGLRTTGSAISLSPNAWRALDALGISSKLASGCDQVRRARVTDIVTGEVENFTMVKPGRDPELSAPRAVRRAALLEALAEEVPTDWIRFSSKVVSIDQTQVAGSGHLVTICLQDGAVIKSKVLIGCDGLRSLVANWLGLAPPVYVGRTAVVALSDYAKGLEIRNEARQWLHNDKRWIYGSANEKHCFWFLVFTTPGEESKRTRGPEEIKKEVLELHESDFPPFFKEVVENSIPTSLTWAPLMIRKPWSIVFGTLSKGGVTVAGDAMHPMTPDLGQGGCVALEDAIVLGRHIANSYSKNGGKLVAAEVGRFLEEYAQERRWRTAFLVAQSYMAGRLQQLRGGSGYWVKKLVRMGAFYRSFAAIFGKAGKYDCGELPKHDSGGVDCSALQKEMEH